MTKQTKMVLGVAALLGAGYLVYLKAKKPAAKKASFVKKRYCSECLQPNATTCSNPSTEGCPKNAFGQQMVKCCESLTASSM